MEGENNSISVITIQNDEETNTILTANIVSAEVISISNSQVLAHENINPTNAASSNEPLILENNEESRQRYFNIGLPLYKAVLKGDWKTAKRMINQDRNILTLRITKLSQNILHLAAGTKHVKFVEELVNVMNCEELELQDSKENTALSFAVSAGSVQIADILIRKNPRLATMRGRSGVTSLYWAVYFGHSEMAWYLYPKTEECLSRNEIDDIFFACINAGLYDLALKMLEKDERLAMARDYTEEKTALHILAETPSAFRNQSSRGWTKLTEWLTPGWNFLGKRNLKQDKALQLLRRCRECVFERHGYEDVMKLIRHPSELLFSATKLGNFKFLAELINNYPELIWEVSPENWTIIHVAVLYRHGNIFNLIHEIESVKNIITTYEDEDENNILHLAAKSPPEDRQNVQSAGAALQMQQELLWFESVKKIVKPLYVKKVNKLGKTPEELFTTEHEKLSRKGEEWMKSTANSCLLVSTIIATVVFAAAFTLPGGNNDSLTLKDLDNTSFLVFVLSDGISLFSSIVAMLMFSSILMSRFAQYDFLRSLPLKLMIGLASLFISIVSMMTAYSITFIIAYHNGLKWVPFLISILAFVPIVLFAILQFPLLLDTFSTTFFSGILFQRNGMLY